MRTLKGSLILIVVFFVVGWSHPWGRYDTRWGRLSIDHWTPADLAGCVAYYPLGLTYADTVANTTQDLSGYENTGTAPNGLGAGTFGTDRFGRANRAMVFDGVNDYLNLNHPAQLSFAPSEPFTISLWLYPEDLSGSETIIGKGTAGGADYEYRLRTGTNILYIACYSPTASSYIGRSAPFSTTGEWFHICVTYDGGLLSSSFEIYVNNVRVDDADYTVGIFASMTDNSADVLCGAYSGGEYLDAMSQDIALYNKVLAEGERTKLYTRRY